MLVDLAVELHETEQVKRIPWERCTSKCDEAEWERQVKELRIDKDGMVRVGTAGPAATADASTIMQLSDAMVRRGAALHIASVLSWGTHQALANEILAALKAEAPPGMARATMSQARAFDQEVWRRTAELAEGRVKSIDGAPPLDAILLQVMLEPRVAMLLLPRFSGGGSGGSSHDQDSSRVQRLEAQVADLKRQLPQGGKGGGGKSSGGSKGSGGGKGGGGNNKRQRGNNRSQGGTGKGCRIPGLEGMNTFLNGKSVCFGYNLGTCQLASPGGQCPKGHHVCGGCGSSSCKWSSCPSRK